MFERVADGYFLGIIRVCRATGAGCFQRPIPGRGVYMKTVVSWGVALAGLGAGAGALWRWRWRRAADGVGDKGAEDRWLLVTVNRPPDEVVSDGRLPDPLARLGDVVEVQVRPAPGGRGTELAARLVDPARPGPVGWRPGSVGRIRARRYARPCGKPSR